MTDLSLCFNSDPLCVLAKISARSCKCALNLFSFQNRWLIVMLVNVKLHSSSRLGIKDMDIV